MTISEQTLLRLLQSRTIVDCDTLDAEVAKSLGPFSDCTSNQLTNLWAIARGELLKPTSNELILGSIQLAKENAGRFLISPEELAVEVATVKLQIQMSQHVTGFVHVQVNPFYASDSSAIIADAIRIVNIFKLVDAAFDTSRVCIKIPSTWEGFQACRDLESRGIATLATTVFAIEQCALAGEAGCHYIAPYVNELKVHFEPGFVDDFKLYGLCLAAQRYFDQNRPRIKTQVLPASLTSISEVMMLAGVDHITIAPHLLELLSTTGVSSLEVASIFDTPLPPNSKPIRAYEATELEFRRDMSLPGNGGAQRKLDEAIAIFQSMQRELEEMVKTML